MATITLKNNPVNTVGEPPQVGSQAPDFTLVGTDLGEVKLADFAGKRLVLNIFPSVDTGVCAMSVRRFNELAAELPDTAVLCVSKDLPFAQARFCGAEGIDNVVTASAFRSSFGEDYGVTFADSPMAGLLSRVVIVVDTDGQVAYVEQVPEVTQEPNYDAALDAVKGLA